MAWEGIGAGGEVVLCVGFQVQPVRLISLAPIGATEVAWPQKINLAKKAFSSVIFIGAFEVFENGSGNCRYSGDSATILAVLLRHDVL